MIATAGPERGPGRDWRNATSASELQSTSVQLLPVACAVFDGLAARDVKNMRSLADQSLKISSGGLTSLHKLIPLLRVVEVGSAQ